MNIYRTFIRCHSFSINCTTTLFSTLVLALGKQQDQAMKGLCLHEMRSKIMNKYINKRHKELIYVATSDWIIKDCLFEDVKLGSDGVRKLVTQRSMGEHIREQKQLLHEGQCQQILGGVREAGQCG